MSAAELIEKLAAEHLSTAVRARNALHGMPEPSGGEHKTTAYIKEFLTDLGLQPETTTFGTGCVVTVGEGSDNVLLRADIDALPVSEATGVPFESRNPGYMHACGHDVHAGALLAVAEILAKGKFQVPGRTILLFQPAEEGQGGCRTLVRQGLLERYRPRRAAALHVWPGMGEGTVGLIEGPMMAGVNHLKVAFKGGGGHGAIPQKCADTVAAAALFITTAQQAVTRRTDPLMNSVVTFCTIHGGTAANIIPSEVTAEGTLRWYSEEAQTSLMAALTDAAKSAAAVFGAEAEVVFDEGYIPTVNDSTAYGELLPVLREVFGPGKVERPQRSMGSEDMGFILREVPGCYVKVGAGAAGAGALPLHSAGFLPAEETLKTGVKTFLAALTAFGGG